MSSTILRFGALLWVALPVAAQSPWLSPYGDSGCGGGFVPTLHTGGQAPVVGNAAFRLVSENLTGGAPGIFLVSGTSANLLVLGMTLYVGPSPLLGVACQANGTAKLAGAGAVNLPLSIPGRTSLVGSKLYVQGFFLDTSLTSSFAHTHGLGVTLAQSLSPALSAIHDRVQYKALFAGLTAQQADGLGRTIWMANQVPGFSYLRTDQFACGGEAHWMVIVLHARTGVEFCLIPGGSFRMGDIYRTGSTTELPVHWVRIPPFLMARTELTQAAWQGQISSNPSFFQGANLPVETVSLVAAQEWCRKAGLRVPSEAEWEYACRAGVDTCYHFGETHPPTSLALYAWYSGNSGNRTHPVAQKLPNAFGLHDMHGNVFEWVADSWQGAYGENYICAPSDGRTWVWTGTGSSMAGVDRGGCFSSYSPLSMRSSGRALVHVSAGRGSGVLGFRPVHCMR